MHRNIAHFTASAFAYNFGYVFVELAEMYQAGAAEPEAWDGIIDNLRDSAAIAMDAHRPEYSAWVALADDDRLN